VVRPKDFCDGDGKGNHDVGKMEEAGSCSLLANPSEEPKIDLEDEWHVRKTHKLVILSSEHST
jgi:hypothetical protein